MYEWDSERNKWLKKVRHVSFEDVIVAIEAKKILETLSHTNKEKYPNQKIYVIDINSYAYYVPFVDDGEKIFLKTIFPNRKATKKYLSDNKNS